MVLPACNQKLRALATQRVNNFKDTAKQTQVIKRLVHLLKAEISFNVYLEYLKNMLEVTEGGFTTHHAFQLIDIRGYKYLDIEGIKEYMVQYNKNMRSRRACLDVNLGTNSKFYKAIMRRMGIDSTKKINYQEFASFLKPSI